LIKCDVLVVGGGASGAVASLVLSKKGYSTILIEKSKSPALNIPTKIDVTESYLIDDIVRDFRLPIIGESSLSKWFSPKVSFTLKSDIKDYFIKRGSESDSFDSITLKNAQDGGCDLLLNSNIDNVEVIGNDVKRVSIKKDDSKKITIYPRYIIIAEGHRSSFNKFIHSTNQSDNCPPISIIAYGFISNKLNIPENTTHVFFDNNYLPGGYFYFISTPDICFSSIVLEKNKLENISVSEYFNNFIKNNSLANMIAKVENKKFVAGSSTALCTSLTSNSNVLFVGDAAGLLDPLFGYGVRQAIYSGYHSANAIATNFNDNAIVLSSYKNMVTPILKENKNARKIRSEFVQMKNEDMSLSFFKRLLSLPSQHMHQVMEAP